MNIAVLGAGAMGSLFGGYLHSAGCDVLLYDIFSEHVDAVNTEGLVIEEPAESREERVHPSATTDPAGVAVADVLIVFVKSTATESIARQFEKIASPDAVVITLQNGYGNEKILRNVFGKERTAAGVTSEGATFLGPGRIRPAGRGPTYLSMSNMNNEKLKPFIRCLEQAGFEAHIEERIQDLIWSKLIINVGINALTALTGLKNGELMDFEETRDLMKELVEEAVSVAGAMEVHLTYDDPVEAVFDVARKTALNRSSMLQDFDRKRTSEIQFINGAIVREAERLGISVPVNRTVTRLVAAADEMHQRGTP